MFILFFEADVQSYAAWHWAALLTNWVFYRNILMFQSYVIINHKISSWSLHTFLPHRSYEGREYSALKGCIYDEILHANCNDIYI